MVDGAPLAGAEMLAEYLGVGNPAPEALLVLVQADASVSYAQLSSILSALRKARVGEVALAAELVPEG
jgi:biopolymer transport protein ExbD